MIFMIAFILREVAATSNCCFGCIMLLKSSTERNKREKYVQTRKRVQESKDALKDHRDLQYNVRRTQFEEWKSRNEAKERLRWEEKMTIVSSTRILVSNGLQQPNQANRVHISSTPSTVLVSSPSLTPRTVLVSSPRLVSPRIYQLAHPSLRKQLSPRTVGDETLQFKSEGTAARSLKA